jgi:hypothetical protein
MKKLLGVAAMLLLAASVSHAQGVPTGTTTLGVTVGAEAAIVIDTTSTNLTSTGTFLDYKGTTNLTYFIRTNNGGAITLAFGGNDFSPAAGPSIMTPVTATDSLTYTCTNATAGTACPSQTVVSDIATYPVASFGALFQSAKAGNAASVVWDLTNDPAYKYGSYSATVTFTISAT